MGFVIVMDKRTLIIRITTIPIPKATMNRVTRLLLFLFNCSKGLKNITAPVFSPEITTGKAKEIYFEPSTFLSVYALFP
jgi:hypothetical protein